MLRLKQFLSLVLAVLFIGSCTDDTVAPSPSGYKGTIYYSNLAIEINKIDLSANTNTLLFKNARYPNITSTGQLLVVEQNPPARLIFSDLTGANRTPILVSSEFPGPIHLRNFVNPRISYDQQYIAYNGLSVNNTSTFVINAKTGELLATIGNYNDSTPLYNPQWMPDGTIIANGATNMNNGIYKVEKDFKTVTNLTPNLTNVQYPSVSPDGTKIAFVKDQQVWMMNSNGTNPIQLYASGKRFYKSTWSPDGKYIAAIEDDKGHIFIIDPVALTAKELDIVHRVEQNDQLVWVY